MAQRRPVASAAQLEEGTAGPIAGWQSVSVYLYNEHECGLISALYSKFCACYCIFRCAPNWPSWGHGRFSDGPLLLRISDNSFEVVPGVLMALVVLSVQTW